MTQWTFCNWSQKRRLLLLLSPFSYMRDIWGTVSPSWWRVDVGWPLDYTVSLRGRIWTFRKVSRLVINSGLIFCCFEERAKVIWIASVSMPLRHHFTRRPWIKLLLSKQQSESWFSCQSYFSGRDYHDTLCDLSTPSEFVKSSSTKKKGFEVLFSHCVGKLIFFIAYHTVFGTCVIPNSHISDFYRSKGTPKSSSTSGVFLILSLNLFLVASSSLNLVP